MKDKLDTKNISILFQGPIEHFDNTTKTALHSVRKIFPESIIILSTWEESDLTGLDYDVLVLNKDPGANLFNVPPNAPRNKENPSCYEFEINGVKYLTEGKKNNVNRMLTTTKNGLEQVSTEYVLKLRTDIILKNADFLKYWDKFDKYSTKYRLFKHRIINNSIYAQFAHVMDDGIQLLPFHISDWIHFGYTEDVKLLFSCEFQDSEGAYNYWNESRKRKKFEPFVDARWQYPPETFILYSLVNKKFNNIIFNDSDDYNERNMQQSNHIIANNFIMLDQDQLRFEMHKYPKQFEWAQFLYDGFIHYYQWQYLYKKYCSPNYNFCDFDYKRFLVVLKNLFNLKLLIKYPRRYYNTLNSFNSFLCKRDLRKEFFIKGDNNEY